MRFKVESAQKRTEKLLFLKARAAETLAIAGMKRLTALEVRRGEAAHEAEQIAQLAFLSERRQRERQLRLWLISLGPSLALGMIGMVIAGLEKVH